MFRSAKYLTTLYTWLGTLILAAYVTDDHVVSSTVPPDVGICYHATNCGQQRIQVRGLLEAFGRMMKKSLP